MTPEPQNWAFNETAHAGASPVADPYGISRPLAFTQAGDGPDVVLIHGALSTRQEIAGALLHHLQPGLRVTAFDRPGHGENPAPEGGSLRSQIEALHASFLRLGLQRPVLVGHSFGGAVALAYALRYPAEIRGVVAIAPIAFPELRLEQVLFGPRCLPGAVGVWNRALGAGLDPLLLPALWRAMFLPQTPSPQFLDEFPAHLAGDEARVTSDGMDAALMPWSLTANVLGYRSCQVPVRILVGGRDLVVNPVLHAHGLMCLLPRGHLTVLPDLGHMLHHFAPETVLHAVVSLHSD